MADDRISLGIRIAEAMGWEYRKYAGGSPRYIDQDGKLWWLTEIVGWAGYGEVNAWMRGKGWKKQVIWLSRNSVAVDFWAGWTSPGRGSHLDDNADEPFAAISAALKALEKQND